jgi:hypothetical protein
MGKILVEYGYLAHLLNVCSWHQADMPAASVDVRPSGKRTWLKDGVMSQRTFVRAKASD